MPTLTADDVAEFVAAWDLPSARRWRPQMRMVSALFKATNAGERPVTAELLAALVGQPVAEALQIARGLGEQVTVENDDVRFALAIPGQSARFWLTIGDRRIGVQGCAPDLFWTAYFVDQPLHIEATCPTTDTAICVDLTAQQVTRVEPATTVVAMVNPSAEPELRDKLTSPEDRDDVCRHMPFFASVHAAATWQASHPGGRVFPVRDFFRLWRAVHMHISGDIAAAR